MVGRVPWRPPVCGRRRKKSVPTLPSVPRSRAPSAAIIRTSRRQRHGRTCPFRHARNGTGHPTTCSCARAVAPASRHGASASRKPGPRAPQRGGRVCTGFRFACGAEGQATDTGHDMSWRVGAWHLPMVATKGLSDDMTGTRLGALNVHRSCKGVGIRVRRCN